MQKVVVATTHAGHWVVAAKRLPDIARDALDHEEVKYFVANVAAGADLEKLKGLLHVAFSQFPIEHTFRQAKDELGMDPFEVGGWTLKNQGFNEMVNPWYAAPVYTHEPRAILNFWLLAMACLHVFLVFYRRNMKPTVHRAANMLNVARRIAAELHIDITGSPARAPP